MPVRLVILDTAQRKRNSQSKRLILESVPTLEPSRDFQKSQVAKVGLVNLLTLVDFSKLRRPLDKGMSQEFLIRLKSVLKVQWISPKRSLRNLQSPSTQPKSR